MKALPVVSQIKPDGAVVLVRVDYNVPMENGNVLDKTRILRTRETIDWLCDRHAKVVLLTHLGRPDGTPSKKLSLETIQSVIEACLERRVIFCSDMTSDGLRKGLDQVAAGELLLMENLRFDPREEKNDPSFASIFSHYADYYVNEAFSVSHRAHCSVHALAQAKPAYAGFAFAREVDMLTTALETPQRPVVALLGGAKISTKINVIHSLLNKVDHLLIGGNMAHCFLQSQGKLVCQNTLNADKEFVKIATEILGQDVNGKIILPQDGVIEGHPPQVRPWEKVKEEDWVFDMGPASIDLFSQHLSQAKTILWNGPVGKIETSPFDQGSQAIARGIAAYTKGGACSIAGGGETLSVLEKTGLMSHFSYTSTAGGAFLEFIEGRQLPGLQILM